MKTSKSILIRNFNLKNISHFKIGGKAKYYFIPDELKDLQDFLQSAHKKQKKFYIAGNGSNILFNDKYYNGTIISLKGFTNYIMLDKTKTYSGAGVDLNTLIDFSINNSLKGLEKLSGIPGTIGGALVMNAGAFGIEIGKYVEHVKVLTSYGKIKTLQKNDIIFSYRKAVPLNEYIILETCLKLKKGKKEILKKTQKQALRSRNKKQPLDVPSCGSIFKRPGNNYAGALIEKCGLKGYSIGHAKVSEKHANFIINTGNAKAQDVMELIKFIREQVHKNFKIMIEPKRKLFKF